MSTIHVYAFDGLSVKGLENCIFCHMSPAKLIILALMLRDALTHLTWLLPVDAIH